MVLLKIKNTGNTPIPVEDFETNIIISTGGIDVLDVALMDKIPDDLNPEIHPRKNDIVISPLLLNPNDEFRLKILLLQPPAKLIVRSRIKSIKEITEIKDRSKKWIIGIVVSMNIAFLWSMLTFAKSIDLPILHTPFNQAIARVAMATLGIYSIIMIIWILRNKPFRSKN
ncbi:hypothetical protein ACFL45_09915 [Candidatus Neomarinimicrobiota bacterium]